MKLFKYNANLFYLCDYEAAKKEEKAGRPYNPINFAVYAFKSNAEREEFINSSQDDIVNFYTF